MLKDVRNAERKLVAQINEASGEVIIVQHGCITKIRFDKNGTISVANTRTKEPVA